MTEHQEGEKNTMKRIASFVMAAGMALSLAACGGAASSTATSTAESTSTAATETTDGGEILIGCLQDITGNTSGPVSYTHLITVMNVNMADPMKINGEKDTFVPTSEFVEYIIFRK